MSSKFDWRAEDEKDWENLPVEEPKRSSNRRRWLVYFIVLASLVGAGAFFYDRLQKQVNKNTQDLMLDVQSSYALLQTAYTNDDNELFYTLLSGRDPTWTATQSDLFRADLLNNRTPFGLQYEKLNPPDPAKRDDSLAITFNPDLSQAEVVHPLPYAIDIGNGLTETVTLQQTSIYRIGENRWLLAPPLDTFWGDEELQEGVLLTANYPARDAEIAAKLTRDLERKLDEMCQVLPDLGCPDDLQVNLAFSTDPQWLAATSHPQTAIRAGETFHVTLPSPTLVGVPIDDAGYQALFRGYGAQLLTAVIAQLTGYNCCQQLPLFQALVNYQLAQLSLKPWPVTSEDYLRVIDERVRINDLATVWHNEDPVLLSGSEGWRVYVNLDYLLNNYPDLTAAQLQRQLVNSESFFVWLNQIFSGDSGVSTSELHREFIRHLWFHAYPQSKETAVEQEHLAIAQSGQDLLIVCSVVDEEDPQKRISSLYRYNSKLAAWSKEYETPNYLFLSPLPGDESVLLQAFSYDNERWQTNLWKNDALRPIQPSANDYSLSFGQTTPDGSGLLAFIGTEDSSFATISLYDLNDCEQDVCRQYEIPGIPVWSPDGRELIVSDLPEFQLGLLHVQNRTILFDSSYYSPTNQLFHARMDDLLADQPLNSVADMTFLGQGYAPFWLDKDSIGYIAPADLSSSRSDRAIFSTSLRENSSESLLTVEDLLPAIPDADSQQNQLRIQYAQPHPQDPNRLFVVAFTRSDREAYLFSFDRQSGQVEYLMNLSYNGNHSLGFSADGRYLVLTGNDVYDPHVNQENTQIFIYDLEEKKTTPFFSLSEIFSPFITYDWTADNQWISFMLDDNLIGIFAPNSDTLHFLETDFGECLPPAWINRS